MKQKRLIKKIAKIGLTLMLIFGGSYLIGKQKTANYSDINDVYKIAEALDTDTAVITNSGTNDPVRLQHNGEEPIYIAIDNEFSDGQKEGINQAIDYVFGIVNSINSNYTYEIVENTEAAEKFLRGKTVIYYNLGYDYKYSAGSIFRVENIFTITAGCSLRNIARINIEEEDWAIDNIVEVSIHELLHAFGFDDVYTLPPYPWIQKTDRYYGNTFMQTRQTKTNLMITPNDYKNLIALYVPQMTEEQMQTFIAEKTEQVKQYEQYYYDYVSKHFGDRNNITKSILDTSKDYSCEGKISVADENRKIINTDKYQIEIKDGKYNINIYDINNKLLESTQGEIVVVGNTIVLKDVDFKLSYRPSTGYSCDKYDGGYVSDMLIMQDEEGDIRLINTADNHSMRLNEKQIEKVFE